MSYTTKNSARFPGPLAYLDIQYARFVPFVGQSLIPTPSVALATWSDSFHGSMHTCFSPFSTVSTLAFTCCFHRYYERKCRGVVLTLSTSFKLRLILPTVNSESLCCSRVYSCWPARIGLFVALGAFAKWHHRSVTLTAMHPEGPPRQLAAVQKTLCKWHHRPVL